MHWVSFEVHPMTSPNFIKIVLMESGTEMKLYPGLREMFKEKMLSKDELSSMQFLLGWQGFIWRHTSLHLSLVKGYHFLQEVLDHEHDRLQLYCLVGLKI